MMAVLFQWEPLCILQGRSCSGGLFWVFFWAVAKEYLARGAKTAMPDSKHHANIVQPDPVTIHNSKTKIAE